MKKRIKKIDAVFEKINQRIDNAGKSLDEKMSLKEYEFITSKMYDVLMMCPAYIDEPISVDVTMAGFVVFKWKNMTFRMRINRIEMYIRDAATEIVGIDIDNSLFRSLLIQLLKQFGNNL